MNRDERKQQEDVRSVDSEARERHQIAIRENDRPERDVTIRDQPPPEILANDKTIDEKERAVGEKKELTPEEKKDLFKEQKQEFREALEKGDMERIKEIVSKMDFSTERSTAVFYSGKSYLSDEQAREFQEQRERGERKWGSLRPTSDGRWEVSNRELAEAFCTKEREHGGKWTTLEQIESGRFLDDQKLIEKLGYTKAIEIWEVASVRYASQASGTVIAFETNADPDKIWLSKELKALLENDEVKNIISDSPRLSQHGREFDRQNTDLRS